tara:strand:+ start:170 stop:361 length:192 start_codon:yes stop_codon:yes gene_type:complete
MAKNKIKKYGGKGAVGQIESELEAEGFKKSPSKTRKIPKKAGAGPGWRSGSQSSGGKGYKQGE